MTNRAIDWPARGIQAAFVLAVLAAWDFAGEKRYVNPILLPAPRRVFARFAALVQTSDLYSYFLVTLAELCSAVVVAAGAGMALGFLVGRSPRATTVFEPLLASVFAVPIIIFLPIFLLFFGIGPESKVAFGAAYAFFPIALNTIGGIRGVDGRYVDAARAMGAGDSKIFRRVLLPAALPVIVAGLRIGCVVGFLSIIGAEMIAGVDGLGSQIVRQGEAMNTADMFAWIVFVILLAVGLNAGLTRLQSHFAPPEGAAS